MKKTSIYIALGAIIGLLAGFLIFGDLTDSKKPPSTHNHSSETADQMWTCSMHPQIMQPEPGSCPICGMDLIRAEIDDDGLSPDQFKMTENAIALANIQTSIVGGNSSDVDIVMNLSGKIAVNEEAIAVQASYFDGRIEQLNVNYEGKEVRKGQLLATIYSPELVAAQQELLTAVSLKQTQAELYNAVRNKLKLWKLSESQINSIEQSGKVREYFPVYATVSGTVSEVLSSEGDYVKKGEPIVKLSNLNTVWASFDAYESQLSYFKTGQNIKITSSAYPDKVYQGKLSFIDPVLNNSTRTVAVRATLNNKEGHFKPGMFVSGSITTKQKADQDDVLLVPSSAVMWTGERSVVYLKVKSDESAFEMREVMVGARTGEEIEVLSGLSAGDEIVTNGTFSVDAAAQLKGIKSMMNKSGSKTMAGHEGHPRTQNNAHGDAMGSNFNTGFSDAFHNGFQTVLGSYFKLKDALVESNATKTATFANATLAKLKKLNLKDLGEMENAHLTKSMHLLGEIAKQKDLDKQRAYFVSLNEYLVAVTSELKVSNNPVYVQKCPMANSNKGAIWLSAEGEIRNPYFGDAMLSCGEVIEVIPAR